MRRITRMRPSPAFAIAVLALAAALAGTAFAGPTANTSISADKVKKIAKQQGKKQGRKQAKKQIEKTLPIGGDELGTIVERTSTTTIATGEIDSTTATCSPGEKVITGGLRHDLNNNTSLIAEQNYRVDDGWRVGGTVVGNPGSLEVTAYVYCLDQVAG